MSDPMNTRPPAPPPPPPPGSPPARPPGSPPPPPPPPLETTERKGASPLIWILILIALIAIGWYFYNRQAGTTTDAGLTAPNATSDAMTPSASDSVERGPAPAPKATKPSAKPAPISRDAALIGQPTPDYPADAARAREEGTVTVLAQLDAAGNVTDTSVDTSSRSRTLDRAALKDVRSWKFSPKMEGGKAVASSIKVPVDYTLKQ